MYMCVIKMKVYIFSLSVCGVCLSVCLSVCLLSLSSLSLSLSLCTHDCVIREDLLSTPTYVMEQR